jgi:hypothetical protein
VLALLIGTFLAVSALFFVLRPLFAVVGPLHDHVRPSAKQAAGAAEQDAVVALREIEFDRATGKLSDSDYDELRVRYTERALEAMRAGALSEAGDDPADAGDAAVEAAVLAYRARLKQCPQCGPRPEPGAIYCSTCGAYLPNACGSCGSVINEPDAAFCASCGGQLAA